MPSYVTIPGNTYAEILVAGTTSVTLVPWPADLVHKLPKEIIETNFTIISDLCFHQFGFQRLSSQHI